jgi:C-terminal processing protease CtpA/Prc
MAGFGGFGDDELEVPYDIAINIHKGANGYGIYFTQRHNGIQVTKIDADSEASRAGVQVNDMLYSVQDLDKRLPLDRPGAEVIVDSSNYHEALQFVRSMKYCRLAFKSGTMMRFQ